MHGWESDSPADTLSNTHSDHGAIVHFSHDGSEQGADDVDGHREEHDPLGREQFRDTSAGNLREKVSPEVTAEDRSLKGLAPVERSILKIREEVELDHFQSFHPIIAIAKFLNLLNYNQIVLRSELLESSSTSSRVPSSIGCVSDTQLESIGSNLRFNALCFNQRKSIGNGVSATRVGLSLLG